jgi:hypothetical protein
MIPEKDKNGRLTGLNAYYHNTKTDKVVWELDPLLGEATTDDSDASETPREKRDWKTMLDEHGAKFWYIPRTGNTPEENTYKDPYPPPSPSGAATDESGNPKDTKGSAI